MCSQVHGSVAVPPHEVNLVLFRFKRGETLSQRLGRGQNEVGRTLEIARRAEGPAPGGVRVVANDEVNTAGFKGPGRSLDQRPGVRGRGQAVGNGAHPKIAEVPVVAHLGIKQYRPAQGFWSARDSEGDKTSLRS